MNPKSMDPPFAAALRTALVEEVGLARARRLRRRVRIGACAFGAVGIVGGGVAVAFDTPPGRDDVRALSEPVTVERTGTATIALGPRPARADHIDVSLVCLTAGSFTFPGGAGMDCDGSDLDGDERYRTMTYGLELLPGENATTVSAGPRERWRLTARYTTVRTTAWAVNEAGDTYGVDNANGRPDLVATWATNGRQGYVYARELAVPSPTSPAEALQWQAAPRITVHVPVFASDGETVIGEFVVSRSAAGQAAAAGREPIVPMQPTAAPRAPIIR